MKKLLCLPLIFSLIGASQPLLARNLSCTGGPSPDIEMRCSDRCIGDEDGEDYCNVNPEIGDDICAGYLECWCPFAGLDFKYAHLTGKRDWKHGFPKRYPYGNIYAGFRFYENIGLELGYEQTPNRSFNHVFEPNTDHAAFFGTDMGTFAYSRNIQFRTTHLDLNYYLPLDTCFTVLASIGFGYVLPKMKEFQINPPPNALAALLLQAELRKAVIFRARLGFIYYLTDYFGFRVLGGFDNMNRVRLRRSPLVTQLRTLQISERPLADSFSGSIGFVVLLN